MRGILVSHVNETEGTMEEIRKSQIYEVVGIMNSDRSPFLS